MPQRLAPGDRRDEASIACGSRARGGRGGDRGWRGSHIGCGWRPRGPELGSVLRRMFLLLARKSELMRSVRRADVGRCDAGRDSSAIGKWKPDLPLLRAGMFGRIRGGSRRVVRENAALATTRDCGGDWVCGDDRNWVGIEYCQSRSRFIGRGIWRGRSGIVDRDGRGDRWRDDNYRHRCSRKPLGGGNGDGGDSYGFGESGRGCENPRADRRARSRLCV